MIDYSVGTIFFFSGDHATMTSHLRREAEQGENRICEAQMDED